jgi:hypothetical protein
MGFDNCYAVEYPGGVTELFTLEVVYNGFFYGTVGSKGRLLYECCSVDHFDNCSRETWSLSTLNEILMQLDCHRNGKMQVYWLLPGKSIMDGLVCIETQAHIREMVIAAITEKTLVIYIDHSGFLNGLREDVLVRKPQRVVLEEVDSGAGP